MPSGEEFRGFRTVNPTPEIFQSAKVLLEAYAAARVTSEELDSVMFSFGRSCFASLPRDALLEAAIGLEMLLVPDAGDSTWIPHEYLGWVKRLPPR